MDRLVDDANQAEKDDAKRREVSASGDVVEAALARAIEAELDQRGPGWEGRVALLAGELRARRLGRRNVAIIDEAKGRRGA